MKSDAFRDQVVIVTGASAGIGKALALLLASQGAKVALAARRTERLDEVAAECRRLGGKALAIPTDVTDEAQCKALIEKTVEAFGRLDMLINNAGLAVSALFDEFPDLHLFKHTMDVNFYGAVYCTYYALPHLKQTKGRVVAISSLGGKSAIPYNSPYIASKYAMHGFYDTLRMELRQHGVSCTVVCPSWVATEFHEAQMNKDGVPRGSQGRMFYTRKTMSAERCATLTLRAAYNRRRELLMGGGGLVVWLKVLAPGLVDWLAIKLFIEPILRRAQAAGIQVKPRI
jgi:short-subunit dehydrogenase